MSEPAHILKREPSAPLALFTMVVVLSLLPAVAHAGCFSDDECKAGRICEEGRCQNARPCSVDRECPGEFVCEARVCRTPVVEEAFEPIAPPSPETAALPVAPTSLADSLPSPAAEASPTPASESGGEITGGRFLAGAAAIGYLGLLNRSEEKWFLYGAGLVGRAGYLTTGLWSFSVVTDLTLAGFTNPEFAVGLGIGKVFVEDSDQTANGLMEIYFSLRRTPFDGAAVVIGVDVVTIGRGIYGGSRLLLGAGFANTYRLGYGVTN